MEGDGQGSDAGRGFEDVGAEASGAVDDDLSGMDAPEGGETGDEGGDLIVGDGDEEELGAFGDPVGWEDRNPGRISSALSRLVAEVALTPMIACPAARQAAPITAPTRPAPMMPMPSRGASGTLIGRSPSRRGPARRSAAGDAGAVGVLGEERQSILGGLMGDMGFDGPCRRMDGDRGEPEGPLEGPLLELHRLHALMRDEVDSAFETAEADDQRRIGEREGATPPHERIDPP